MASAGPTAGRGELPARADQTTAERPWPVRHLNPKISDYVDRMPALWVEGQVLNLKRWNSLYFLTLRDTDLDMSINVTVPAATLQRAVPDGQEVKDGTRLVLHAKPSFHTKRGSLGLQADDARLVGLGELLAQIERLKGVLAGEGLFAPERKKRLPFLPAVVGLVCAQQGDAEHDVVRNARARWPAVQFEIRRVTVQGPRAVPEVGAAIGELDADPRVEVIVVARGGGSFEDLLPFSNEALVRKAATLRTPLVSAIGHEEDRPLLDLVADLRASTPTDAAKRIVPDVTEERRGITQARTRLRQSLGTTLERERILLEALRSRPVMVRPATMLEARQLAVDSASDAARRAFGDLLAAHASHLTELRAQVRALSPAATLERGYAVVQTAGGEVLRDPAQVSDGESLRLRLARGELVATAGAPGTEY
ncbi:MAG: exodeoxyribonuclease VII large subunit [Actinomycetales bacterium]|nr:exodeoxyribonuclease VII large subunit [Actinomycetales bacterium]